MGKKKQESSSSSSSESEEVKQQPKKVTTPAKSTPKKEEPKKAEAKKATPAKDESSSSSSEAVKPSPKPAAVKKDDKKPAAPAKKKAAASSSSSSSSDGEEKKKKAAPAAKKGAAKKDDSDAKASSSSEEEAEEKPQEKKRKAEAEPAAQPPAKKPKTDGSNEPSGRVFVGNLPWSIDDDKIKEFFKSVGTVTEVHWLTNKTTGRFSGNGFLTFSSADEAVAAVALAGTELDGRQIKVDHAAPRMERGAAGGGFGAAGTPRQDRTPREATPKPDGCTTVFLGNLSFSIDEDTVRGLFSDCGEITSVRWVERDGQFKGCGFVEFSDSSATDTAVGKNGQDVLGRPIRVDYSAPKPPKKF